MTINDESIEAVQAIAAVGGTFASGFTLTQYVLNSNLTEEQKRELVDKTRTDYVTVEHLGNNMLVTEYYQKSEDISLFHTEIKRKKILLTILKTNKNIFKQQKKLVDRYQALSEKQERLNRIIRYLALAFILSRIYIFCLNNLL